MRDYVIVMLLLISLISSRDALNHLVGVTGREDMFVMLAMILNYTALDMD
jgi:hypothetical protein